MALPSISMALFHFDWLLVFLSSSSRRTDPSTLGFLHCADFPRKLHWVQGRWNWHNGNLWSYALHHWHGSDNLMDIKQYSSLKRREWESFVLPLFHYAYASFITEIFLMFFTICPWLNCPYMTWSLCHCCEVKGCISGIISPQVFNREHSWLARIKGGVWHHILFSWNQALFDWVVLLSPVSTSNVLITFIHLVPLELLCNPQSAKTTW